MSINSELSGELEDAMEEVEELHGSPTLTYSSTAYACLPQTETYRKSVEDVGFLEDFDCFVVVRQSVWTPGTGAINGTVTYNGTSYRITEIKDHPAGHYYVLALNKIK